MKRFLLPAIITLLSVACVNDNLGDLPTEDRHSGKIRNWGENAAAGRLMVCLAEGGQELSIEGLSLDVEPLFRGTKSQDMARWQLVTFDESLDLRGVAERIAACDNVEYVEFDLPIKRIAGQSVAMPTTRCETTRATTLPFNDPELPYQWHYHNDGSLSDYADIPSLCLAGADINLLNAWKYTAGDNRVIVAVIDGGIMTDHADLEDNMWVNEAERNGIEGVDDDNNGFIDDIHGYNFVHDKGEIVADSHGTHVAGTISAVNNNGYAVCGIAGGTGKGDGVRLMSIQIFNGDEGCYSHQLAQAFMYAADNGAVIANNSWGYDPGGYRSDKEFEKWDSTLHAAIDYFEENAGLEGVMEGGLAIFAAGNETFPESAYPAAYNRYISVTAMSSDYTAAFYTNYGPGCNIAAPGGDANYGAVLCIESTSTDPKYGVEYMQGTSMATPHVTGCAALALSYALKQGYTLTNDELRNLILTSTIDINSYQVGTKRCFDYEQGIYYDMDLAPYAGKLGSGNIDAHKLLMQLDGTPCLYFRTNETSMLSLDEFFGGSSNELKYNGCEVSDEVRETLGITTTPRIDNGLLRIECTKPGTGRIKVSAIVGGDFPGGNDMIGGMIVEREFEVVVRGSVADNGGWL
ncbi:MAG: S8 family serine peptidase [Alistipes sp.]|nr:S8 family serine peptidase [Alistipes sp.]